jgi:hypothetical protein
MLITVYCTIGWVDIGIGTKVPLRFVTYLSKVTKINEKKCFDPVIASSLVKTLWIMHYVKIFFVHNMDFMGIRRRRILRRFQKYSDKMHLKKIFQVKDFRLYAGCPLCSKEILFSLITFLCAFCL